MRVQNTSQARKRVHLRVRKKVIGTRKRPRLAVYRSAKHIYAQAIDDGSGRTLVAASSREKDVSGGGNIKHAASIGKRVAERLEEQEILGPKTLVAHAIHVDAFEMDSFRATKTKISHQPRSNMNNAVGVTEVEKLLDRGITVGLGNDGFYNNMFTEIHTAYLLHRVSKGDPLVVLLQTVCLVG